MKLIVDFKYIQLRLCIANPIDIIGDNMIYNQIDKKFIEARFILEEEEFDFINEKNSRFATIDGIGDEVDKFGNKYRFRAEVGINNKREIICIFNWRYYIPKPKQQNLFKE
tara:strand:+ start:1199 stop:1531 length:333 start_codon:yes stop_codon:yes gene_type:complete